jgi:hypothetical protein
MRKFWLGVLAIVTLSTLAGGKYHWDQRVSAVQVKGHTEKVSGYRTGMSMEEKKEEDEEKVAAEEVKNRLVKLDKLNYLPPE